MTTDLPDERVSRVLIADDDQAHAISMAATLAELGHIAVGPVSDGEAAVELARKALPDLALLDIRMPRLDGIQAATILYQELAIPVVMLTGHADPEFMQAAGDGGVFGYLIKPASAEQINAALIVAWKRYQDRLAQDGEIRELQQKLEDRRIIERAKWILVKGRGIPEPEAMRVLQQQARKNRTKLAEVAKATLESAWMLDRAGPTDTNPPDQGDSAQTTD